MRIIPFEIEFDYWIIDKHNYSTARLAVLHFEGTDAEASLLELGWYQGNFVWDFLFIYYIKDKIERWLENR